jgi:hypothetical protein
MEIVWQYYKQNFIHRKQCEKIFNDSRETYSRKFGSRRKIWNGNRLIKEETIKGVFNRHS